MKDDKAKVVWSTIVTLIMGTTIVIAPTGFGAEGKQGNRQAKSTEVGKKTVRKSNSMPVYKAPICGYPKERQCGGSRGSGVYPLHLIIPDDRIGRTVSDQPILYWDLLKPIRNQAEFTLIDNVAVHPLLEIDLGPKMEAGMYHISLADYGVRLMPCKLYRWFVSIILDPKHRSKDFVLEGGIEFIVPEEPLTKRVSQASREEVPYVYAESGIWYDALAAITGLINDAPDNIQLRKQRASLIEQIGLRDVAEYEMKSGNLKRQSQSSF
ncbi:MAG: DUF928 domain-containing protein [Candidatus Scalindua sp. AMX11]|nr:MAG: DUF928 domain-containing protein [Candidatus Scalindua sp.]NOG85702.1 DUF928 domain-containing protein [Planctomycetota bacterium]RZV73153.1 MAG: DUF928 domain-containing protein [Candidatus Scalindua sp. SCAELEC01]TDE64759.1 MAG: DUF928 domain-containing protein [Candidatus Scalindua sp. AMX11]GJQ58676.1 MAG: hypothetical protein SCALA701_14770 [Candidatus Scalindua sp.]